MEKNYVRFVLSLPENYFKEGKIQSVSRGIAFCSYIRQVVMQAIKEEYRLRKISADSEIKSDIEIKNQEATE